MPAPAPQKRDVAFLKTKIMQPALTSHFECHFSLPSKLKEWFGYNQLGNLDELGRTLTISCSEASLPGSSLATHELNNDFTGVTQRHAYRRLYDDRADFTFYVNEKYEQIRVFESWIRYIAGEQISTAADPNGFYRVQYPVDYKTEIYITKFERNLGVKNTRPNRIVYSFFNAFPISINSMPVSYDSSQLLKCTVSFTYDRYVTSNNSITPSSSEELSQFTAGGVPDLPGLTGTGALGGTGNISELFNNIAPSQYNISPGTLSNSVGEGEELANAVTRPVEEGLPYVGRNVGPLAP